MVGLQSPLQCLLVVVRTMNEVLTGYLSCDTKFSDWFKILNDRLEKFGTNYYFQWHYVILTSSFIGTLGGALTL